MRRGKEGGKKRNTAAKRRARECGKAVPATPVFIVSGRGLVTSQPSGLPREWGGVGLRPAAEGGSGRDRRETRRGRKGAKGGGAGDPECRCRPPGGLLPSSRLQLPRRGASDARTWAGEGEETRLVRSAAWPRFSTPSGVCAHARRWPPLIGSWTRVSGGRNAELCWVRGGGMLALPGEAVGEACEGLRRSSHFECAPRFEGSIGYAWGLSSQGEAPALEGIPRSFLEKSS